MAKKLKIDYSEDRLLSMASDMLDDHNYLGALKMLNRNVQLGGENGDTFGLYADAYDDMELYEKCINMWFKYIDSFYDGDLSGAHEGLAMAYMNLGRDDVSAYYYDKLLKESGEVSEMDRSQLIKAFLGEEKNPLKIVYPPEKADYSEEISQAVDMMRSGNFNSAAEKLADIAEGNPEYLNARNYMAMCYILGERYDEAEQVCRDILEKDENNIQAMISYAAVKSERGEKEESVACANKLIRIKADEPEDIYKIATVCCENDMHAEAYEVFCRLGEEMQYDFNMLYFKSIAAFNSGKREKGVEILQKLLTIYPGAVIARRTMERMKEAIAENSGLSLAYYYRLPIDERERSVKLLIVFDKLSKSQLKTFTQWDELRDVVMWCLDEADSRTDKDMLRAAAGCAIKAEFDDVVRNLLLNAFIGDDVKIGMLQKLCERNQENNFGVVICNIYRSVDLYGISIGRTKRKIFITAYADLVCRFALIDGDYSRILAGACEYLYDSLEEKDKLGLCTDESTVVAAMFASSRLKFSEVFNGDICAFFGADRQKFDEIMENV